MIKKLTLVLGLIMLVFIGSTFSASVNLINAGGIINVYAEIVGYDMAESMRRTENIYNTTLEIFDYPILIQNFKGEIKAFENICPHRFNKIQTETRGKGLFYVWLPQLEF